MSLFCFVPNCNDTAVIPFPKDSNSVERCWKLFEVQVPNASSFLCVRHYNDIRRYQDGKGPWKQHPSENWKIKSGSTYELLDYKVVRGNEQDNLLEQAPRDIYSTKVKVEKIVQDQDSDCKEDIDFEEHLLYDSDFNDFQNGYIVCDTDKIIGNPENRVSFNQEIQSGETSTVFSEEEEQEYSFTEELQDQSVNLEKCRLCMREQAHTKNVFDDYLEDIPIYLAIESCFSPIQICRTDKLSKRICLHCWWRLKSYFNFKETVLKNDKTQRKLFSQTDDNHKRKNDSTPPLPKKMKRGEAYLKKISGKNDILQPLNNREKTVGLDRNKLHAENKGLKEKEKLVRIEDELQKCDNLPEEQASAENIHVQNDSKFHDTKTIVICAKDSDAISNHIHRKIVITGNAYLKIKSGKNDIIHPLNNREKTVGLDKNKLHAENKGLKEKETLVRIEDELQKVLHDNLPEDQASAENIVLHVQNDSEFHNTKTIVIDAKDAGAISNPIHRKTIITGEAYLKKKSGKNVIIQPLNNREKTVRLDKNKLHAENKDLKEKEKLVRIEDELQKVSHDNLPEQQASAENIVIVQNDSEFHNTKTIVIDAKDPDAISNPIHRKIIFTDDAYLKIKSGKNDIIQPLNNREKTVGLDRNKLHAENKGLKEKEKLVRIEDELQKVLHDNVPKEQASAKNIVIHVQNNSEFHNTKTIAIDAKDPEAISNPIHRKIIIAGDAYLKKKSGKHDIIQPLNNREKTVGLVKNKLHAEHKGLEEKEKLVRTEDELQKVLHDNLPEDQASAENIVLHVQNDSEFHNTKTIVIDAKDPDAISNPIHHKTIITGKEEDDATVKKSMATPARISTEPERQVTIIDGVEVPKSESKISNSYKSRLGVFKAEQITYIYNTEFCLIDEYLFEYRLHKDKVRNLKCILPTCQATAVQQILGPDVCKAEAEVLIPHNHEKSTEGDRKKQMFFSIMRRKLQSGRGMNFKNIYEIACQKDPFIRDSVPLKSVIVEACRNQTKCEPNYNYSFEDLFAHIEEDHLDKLQFTLSGKQFYQNKFMTDDSKAILFANLDIVEELSASKLMYVDASFKIDTSDKVNFQLVTVLIWMRDSYYPAIFVLIDNKTRGIYTKIFQYIHDRLAPKLRPEDIVTDYEANLYYALGEVYVESCIGGSFFYYTQNLYKKVCALKLCKELETNAYLRNVYHMLLMLPLLPVNTILDALNNLEIQSKQMELMMKPLFQHVRSEWIEKVTPDLFCVHSLENRINENVMASFKKLRDMLLSSKSKPISVVHVVKKLIDLENFLQIVYSDPSKKYFSRDHSCAQKKNVLKAWHHIEIHPKITIDTFFSKVLGYIKCMENQLWIWGLYRYTGDFDDELISASNFSITANEPAIATDEPKIADGEAAVCQRIEEQSPNVDQQDGQVVVEGVVDIDASFVLQDAEDTGLQIQNTCLEDTCDT